MAEMSQAAMRAKTDQAIARVAHMRANPPDEAAVVTMPAASDLADLLAAEFSTDAATVGRALVSAASKLAWLLAELQSRLQDDPLRQANAARMVINSLAFAGEEMTRPAAFRKGNGRG